VQHGHTPAEQTIYDFLWNAAAKFGQKESAASRILRVTQPWIAKQIGMHENSVRPILRNLTAKLAIEEVSSHGPALGRGYRIWSYEVCLARRRDAGLIYSVKSHGVQLMTWEQVQPLLGSGEPADPVPSDPVPTELFKRSESVATLARRDVPTESAALYLQNRPSCKEYISNSAKQEYKLPPPPSVIIESLRMVAGEATDATARTIVAACQNRRPDARPREIAHFIRYRGERAQGIANMQAFLIAKVPEHFEGRAFELFREENNRRIQSKYDAQRKALQETLEMCRGLVETDEPDCAEDKAWAIERLAEADRDFARISAEEEKELNS
jgi:hypothetical protein